MTVIFQVITIFHGKLLNDRCSGSTDPDTKSTGDTNLEGRVTSAKHHQATTLCSGKLFFSNNVAYLMIKAQKLWGLVLHILQKPWELVAYSAIFSVDRDERCCITPYCQLIQDFGLMNNLMKIALRWVISVTLIVSCSVAAATPEINEAVKKYYAGFPDEAIGMLKPLALSGDVDAQYLLGNILYSLSKTGKFDQIDDPVRWYKMAAAQQSIGANYALGNIFHDRWLESRNRQDAANAIVYYQRTVDSGYTKAQVSLNRIKSRSGISQRQAAALVKQQATAPVPQAEVQPPEKPAAVTVPQAEVQPPEKPAAVIVPQAEAQLPEKPAAGSESGETPTAASSPAVADNKAMEQESSVEPEADVDDTKQIAQIVEQPGDEVAITITLADIAAQCQNFTEEGFNLYAETIQEALFSGKASLVGIRPDASKPGTYLTKLASNQYGTVIFLDMHDVPEAVATSFAKGIKYDVTGPVVDAKAVGSNCTVNLIYQSVNG